MDAKVKAMIKLIEEDADSFARRAEMYYKKRPELMKLVEEFYRAYRALAERYDHATGELRQAHRTMAEAFPNQVPFVLTDDSPVGSSATEVEPHTPEMPHPMRTFFDPDDLHKDALGSSSHFQAIKRNGAYSEESDVVTSKKGLKQLYEMFGSGDVVPHHANVAEGRVRKGLKFHELEEKERSLQDEVSQLSTENQNLKNKVTSESERAVKAETEIQTLREALAKLEADKEAGQQNSEKLSNLENEASHAEEEAKRLNERTSKAETEVQALKGALAKLEAEKDAGLLQYQQSLEMLSNLETEVSRAQEDARRLNEQAGKAETEVQTLKEALSKLEAEKEAGLLQYQQCLERISNLEIKTSSALEDAGKVNKRASKAETEAQTLKQALNRIEAEKEAALLQCKVCLETISSIEAKMSITEEDARRFSEQADEAQNEIQTLKQAFAKLEEDNEAASLQYQQCLETIRNLESEFSHAQEEAKRLNYEITMGVAKFNSTEEQCLLLERTNQSLHSEVESLVQKSGVQNQELSEMHEELERLRICIQEERLRLVQAESAIQTLEKLQSQAQDEQRALSLELQNGVQMLKNMEIQNQGLEDDARLIKEENKSLHEQNISSAMSIKNLQEEIFGLRAMKVKLEEEVELRVDQRNALQQEIYCQKEEINDLRKQHHSIMEQVESVGLNSECLSSSVKELQEEKSKLKEICQKNSDEKVALLEKLENMERLLEKNTLLENSLSDVNAELEGLREKIKTFEESCQSLQEEKSTVAAEKATLASQLEVITGDMKKLSEKCTSLENSHSDAILELEGLRAKSKSLEESYQSLGNQNSGLLAERDTLLSQLDAFRQMLENLEKKHSELVEKYSNQEKEKELISCQVEELRIFLNLEKQEHATFTQSSETRLSSLESQIYILQEEGRQRKKEFQEEVDKSVSAQVEIFILQSCIRDMEEKNFSLLIECQKHTEMSKLSEELISELEKENLEQQVEVKSLLDHIENLRMGIQQMLKLLEIDPDHCCEDYIKEDQILFQLIFGKIEDTKISVLKDQNQTQQLLIEKSVLVTLLGQLRLEAADLESERNTLNQELEKKTEDLLILQSKKQRLFEANEQLRLGVSEGAHREEVLKAGTEKLCLKLVDLQGAYLVLQNENSELLEENRSLMEEFLDLKEEKCRLEEENSVSLGEAMALSNLSLIFKCFGAEKAVELKGLSDELDCLLMANRGLEAEIGLTVAKLKLVKTENLHLNGSVEQLENELKAVKNLSDQLNNQIAIGKNVLNQREMEISEAIQKLNAALSENIELHTDLEVLKREHHEVKGIREVLEKQILNLSEDNTHQNKEIEFLHEVNQKFESELGKSREEIEKLRAREGDLNFELQEKRNEVELWEDEAATFYDDLQISIVRQALFEDKVHELTGACESLGIEGDSKTLEIKQLEEKVSILESENGGLKTELSAYLPVIFSLRDSITSLEDHSLLQTKSQMGDNQKPKDAELASLRHDKSSKELNADQSAVVPDGILELQELQTRVKAVEKALVEMKSLATQESLSINIKLDAAMQEIEELTSKSRLVPEKEVQTSSDIVMQPEEMEVRDELSDNLKLLKTETEMHKVKNGLLMKDIQLDQISDCSSHDHVPGPYGTSRRKSGGTDDQMLELWETAERDCSLDPTITKAQKLAYALEDDTKYHQVETMEEQKSEYPSSELQVEKELGIDKLEVSNGVTEPHREGNKSKVLERLASDTQKLMNLQVTLRDLKAKMETSDKTKKAKGVDYDTVKGQLKEVEEAIMHLVDMNGKLMKNVDEENLLSSNGKAIVELGETGNGHSKRVLVQARQRSEKIGRLQLELQRIQFVLLKLEAENENEGKTKVVERKTSVLLREYLYGGGKGRDKRKKAKFCACVRPSTRED